MYPTSVSFEPPGKPRATLFAGENACYFRYVFLYRLVKIYLLSLDKSLQGDMMRIECFCIGGKAEREHER